MNAQERYELAMKRIYGDGVPEDNALAVHLLTQAYDLGHVEAAYNRKLICELNDRIVLGQEGLSEKAPRLTARAIVKNRNGLYAVMYSDKFKLHSLPGGGIEDGEDVLTALRREVREETGCVCDEIRELGIVTENHLTESEQASRTEVRWLPFEEMVRRINEQEFDRARGKYLKARDAAALNAYAAHR